MKSTSFHWGRRMAAPFAVTILLAACGGSGGNDDAAAAPQFPLSSDTSRCAATVGSIFGPATVKTATVVAATATLPEFCKVIAYKTGKPSFEMEAFLPTRWTGGLVHGGGGGLNGSLPNGVIWNTTQPLQQGMVYIASNGGNNDPTGAKLSDPETLRDYSFAHIGTTYEFGQALMQSYYSAEPANSYFVGCSRGGGEAMAAAAIYPDRYDGIIAQAPAPEMKAFIARTSTIGALPGLSAAKWSLLNTTYIDRCDALDGLVDGVVSNPGACTLDPTTVAGWNAGELATIQSVMSDLKLRDGTVVNGKTGYGPAFAGFLGGLGSSWMTYVMAKDEPNYDPKAFDLDTYWPKIVSGADAVSLDVDPVALGAFLRQGKKMLVYMGGDDTALSIQSTKDYHAKAVAAAGTGGGNTQIRFFPGVGHCGGTGATLQGPEKAEMLGALRSWVEDGKAPTDLVAARLNADGSTKLSRPICLSGSYPRYNGSGDTSLAANFTCVAEGT